jgi:hypothetical protein
MGAVEATLLEPPATQAPVAPKARGKVAAGDSASPEAGGAELLLWALAGDRQCEAEGRRALGMSIAEAKAVRDAHAGRFERLRQLRNLGALLTRDDLAVLFRARLAELLLRSDSAGDLAALLRVFDKVPQPAELLDAGLDAGQAAKYQPDGNDLSSLDLAECVAEAQRLLAEIEDEAVDRHVRAAQGRTAGGPWPASAAETNVCSSAHSEAEE